MASPPNKQQPVRAQAKNSRVVGFACEFVQPPPDSLQSECPVCLQIIREPHQVTCCGNSFCHSCIQHIQADNKPCPTCNANGFSNFPNKRLKLSLIGLKVRCSYRKDGCKWTGELGQLDMHLNTDPLPGNRCPFKIINCDFLHVGCSVKLPRKDMPDHLRENLLTHISLLATSHAKQQAENLKLREENAQFKSILATSTKTDALVLQRTTIPLGPPIFIMTNFQQHKRDGDNWISPPVYTHHQGYKICLRVFANGSGFGKGSHVSVLVCFMRGEFDASLKWPFRGVISYRLLDQEKSVNHKTHSVIFTDPSLDNICSRVTDREIAEFGLRTSLFAAHTELEPKYLQNNTLLFQIYKVEVYSV